MKFLWEGKEIISSFAGMLASAIMPVMIVAHARALFPLNRNQIYLDHGSYGVTPREVMREREKWLRDIERAPRKFFTYQYKPAWKKTRALIKERFSIRDGDLALIENTTEGINAILRSFPFREDDEILVTSLTYGAIRKTAAGIAGQRRLRVVEADLQFPDPDPGQCVAAVSRAITPRTKIAVLDHITSSTGLVLPVADMTAVCRARGVAVVVDAAHAPGQALVDINAIRPDWYVANLHKWFFVPRGCGFLWAAPGRQEALEPVVLSWDIDQGFPESFDWTGTRDPSPWLSIPAAFAFMDRFGEAEIRGHNHRLVLEGAAMLAEAWGVQITTPEHMTGSMVLVPLPEGLPYPLTEKGRLKLQEDLAMKFNFITCLPFSTQGTHFIRIAANIYNDLKDYRKLAQAINSLRK